MPSVANGIMQKLYGRNIWDGFLPTHAPREVQGWSGDHPSFARIISVAAAQVVMDIGVWKGQSTITMANALKRSGTDGCVIAIDTFLGSSEHWLTDLRTLFERPHGRPDLYDEFLSNVYHADLTDYVVPLAQTSTTAAIILASLDVRPAVVHVDAAHEYPEVIRDIEEYWRLLVPGGYMIGDDYDEVWPGVVRAAGEFSARVGRPLRIDYPKWIMMKAG